MTTLKAGDKVLFKKAAFIVAFGGLDTNYIPTIAGKAGIIKHVNTVANIATIIVDDIEHLDIPLELLW